MTTILGSHKTEITKSRIRKDDLIGFDDNGYFDTGYILSLVYVEKETCKIAGTEGEDFDRSKEYINNPEKYHRCWIICT